VNAALLRARRACGVTACLEPDQRRRVGSVILYSGNFMSEIKAFVTVL
jgi:hypothetical protein